MNRVTSLKGRLQAGLLLAVAAAAVYAASVPAVKAADAQPKSEAKIKKAEKKQLSGSDLYAVHCNRCHPERYPTERTATQWTTIMLHMRVRANLPADQAKAILKYLQEDSGK